MGTKWTDGTTELSGANLDSMDRGGLVYASPSGGLNVRVTAALIYYLTTPAYVASAWTPSADQLLTGSQTNYIYMSTAGALVINTTGFPDPAVTKHVRLAEVVCGASSITSITDKRPMATI